MTPCYIIFGILFLLDFEDKCVYLKSLFSRLLTLLRFLEFSIFDKRLLEDLELSSLSWVEVWNSVGARNNLIRTPCISRQGCHASSKHFLSQKL